MNKDINLACISKYRSLFYAISAIWIMVFHLVDYFPKTVASLWGVNKILTNGNSGVDIFLFLSGVSLFYSMSRDNRIKNFYARRFAIIGKIYVTVCLFYYILRFFILSFQPIVFIRSFLFFDVNQNGECFWFILMISICYLIYPAIFYAINKKENSVFWIICAYIILLVILLQLIPVVIHKYEIVLFRIPVFLLGCLMGPKVYREKHLSAKILVGIILISIMYIMFHLVLEHSPSMKDAFRPYIDMLLRFRLSFQGLLILVILCWILDSTHLKIPNILRIIGSLSLELYVFHVGIKNLTNKYIPNDSFIAMCIFTLTISFLSFLFALAYSSFFKNKSLNVARE